MKIEVEFDTLKRIAKASPDLTMAQFVAVWGEKLAEERREADRIRKSEKPGIQPETSVIQPEMAGNEPETYEQQEAKFYADMRALCGKNAGGLSTTLLKIHNHQIAAARVVMERARVTSDPKAFIAAACRSKNGTGPGLMDAFDRLDDRAASAAVSDGAPLRDIGPGGH